MPTFNRLRLVIAVSDFAVSVPYYRDVLGFDVEEIDDPGWRFFHKDQVTIMAGECRDAIPARETGDHSYVAQIFVDDLDAYHDQIKPRADIIKPPRDEPWGLREMAVRTPDGHRFMFVQPI